MRGAPHEPPDVLVLGGGGVLGEAWMRSLLAGLASAGGFDARESGTFLGTSAGSIVAALLAAGVDPAAHVPVVGDPRVEDAAPAASEAYAAPSGAGPLADALSAARALGGAAAAPLAALAFSSTAPGGALLRRTALAGVPSGRRSLAGLGRIIEASGAGWDGRLLIATVELRTGRRTIFGADGSPPAPVSAAVLASCAIPGFFEPVSIAGRRYVDGGVWSPTNMDAAPVGRGERVLCLNPTGSLRASMGTLAGALGPVSRAVTAGEALALRHRGARVATISPDRQSAAAMGANLMDARARDAVIEAGRQQGRQLAREADALRRAA